MSTTGGRVVPAACDLRVVAAAEPVADENFFRLTGQLLREEGLPVGGSSGTAVAAALRVAVRGGDGPVVAVLADSWDRYLSRPWLQRG